MALVPLALKPGVNTLVTQDLNRDSWSVCNNIRWKDGLLQKLGGWKRISETLFIGTCRGMHAWASLDGTPYLIIGTEQRVQLYDSGAIQDITPLQSTADTVVNFSTTAGSPSVTVGDAAHGAFTGEWIYLQTQISVGGLILHGYYRINQIIDADRYVISAASNAASTIANAGAVPVFATTIGAQNINVTLQNHGFAVGAEFDVEISVAVGGITVSGTYLVQSVTDANTFVITQTIPATATATAAENSGNARILYLLQPGLVDATYAGIYGAGLYGRRLYGVGGGGRFLTPAREWFFDSWGEAAIGNPTDGGLYIWNPPYVPNNRMTRITQAPSRITVSFVSMPQQVAVTLGSETVGIFDPNLVRWCDVADYTDWTASAINQAGSFRISTGSRIVGGLQGPQFALIWTDLDLWSMRYIGAPFIFGFTKIASGCGMISARAGWSTASGIYWMGPNGFFMSDGNGVRPMLCKVWDTVFANINKTQVSKIHAAANSDFTELSWRYVSKNASEIDSYVKVSLKEIDPEGHYIWDYGSTKETAWEDRSVFGPPVGADTRGYLLQHETSNDADGEPMDSFAESGFWDIVNGQEIQFMDEVIPNAKLEGGAVLQFTFRTKKVPNGPVKSFGPYRMFGKSQYIRPRLRGREVAMRIGSSDMGSFWRIGLIRYRVAPDGRGV
jgi:hypothetical protein